MAGWRGSNCGQGNVYYGNVTGACCELFADEFDRADSNIVGNGWDEGILPDAWSIATEMLRARLSGVGAVVYCLHEIAEGPPEHEVHVDFMFEDYGLTAAVLARVNGLNGACYLSLEVFLDQDDCATLTLHNNKTCESSDFTLATAAVADVTLQEWHHLRLCYRACTCPDQQDVQVYGELTTASGGRTNLSASSTLPVVDPDDYNWVGVMASTGGDHAVFFDNFACNSTEDDAYECCAYCYYGKPYDCHLFSDNFDRADADNLGCLWSNCDDATVVDGTAKFTLQDTYCAANYITTIPAWSVSVSGKGTDENDQIRVLIAIEDSENFLFAQVTVDDDCGNLKLYQRSGGVDTQLGETVAIETAHPDEWHSIKVCWDGTYLWWRVTTFHAEERWYRQAAQIDPNALSSLGGIGVGAVMETVFFDDFSIEYMHGVLDQLKYEDDCERCRPDNVPCIIHSDTFTRTDNDLLGCFWEEVTGDADIVSNTATIISEGIFISNLPNQYGTSDAYVTGSITSPSDGKSARLICDYLDSSNYHFLSITWGSTGIGNADGTMQLYRRAGGTDTALLDDPVTVPGLNAGDMANAILCFDGTYIEGIVNGVSGGTTTTEVGGSRAGFGGFAGIVFESWSFEHIFGTPGTEEEDCNNCVIIVQCGQCLNAEMPTQLKVVIDLTISDNPFPGFGGFCAGGFPDTCPFETADIPRTWFLDAEDVTGDICTWCKEIELQTEDCALAFVPSGPALPAKLRAAVFASISPTEMLVEVYVFYNLLPSAVDCIPDPPLRQCIYYHGRYRRTLIAFPGDELGSFLVSGDPLTGALCVEWDDVQIDRYAETSGGTCCIVEGGASVTISAA